MSKKVVIVPNPEKPNSAGQLRGLNMGYFRVAGRSRQQHTSMACEVFDSPPPLSPVEIGHRLWTTYKELNGEIRSRPGHDPRTSSTASTSVYDGRGNIITATLGNSATFAAVYDQGGNCVGVMRLNSVSHDGTAQNGKIQGPRSLGDERAEAHIDIANVPQIAQRFGVYPSNFGSVQIITTCDGFTAGTGPGNQSQAAQEAYLFHALRAHVPGAGTEQELSTRLARQAIANGSPQSVSIAIQTVRQQTPPMLLGLYDGQGGAQVSSYAAHRVADVFQSLSVLSQEAYNNRPLSVNNRREPFLRDNPTHGEPAPARPTRPPPIASGANKANPEPLRPVYSQGPVRPVYQQPPQAPTYMQTPPSPETVQALKDGRISPVYGASPKSPEEPKLGFWARVGRALKQLVSFEPKQETGIELKEINARPPAPPPPTRPMSQAESDELLNSSRRASIPPPLASAESKSDWVRDRHGKSTAPDAPPAKAADAAPRKPVEVNRQYRDILELAREQQAEKAKPATEHYSELPMKK